MLTVPVSAVAGLAGDGQVWRAFDHLVTVEAGGRLAAWPVGLMDGDLTRVIDGCPVPWAELWALIDTPLGKPVQLTDRNVMRLAPKVARVLSPHGWTMDFVRAAAGVPSFTRLLAPCGVRMSLLGIHDGS